MMGWAILNSFVNGVENTGSEDGMVEFVHNTVIECTSVQSPPGSQESSKPGLIRLLYGNLKALATPSLHHTHPSYYKLGGTFMVTL